MSHLTFMFGHIRFIALVLVFMVATGCVPGHITRGMPNKGESRDISGEYSGFYRNYRGIEIPDNFEDAFESLTYIDHDNATGSFLPATVQLTQNKENLNVTIRIGDRNFSSKIPYYLQDGVIVTDNHFRIKIQWVILWAYMNKRLLFTTLDNGDLFIWSLSDALGCIVVLPIFGADSYRDPSSFGDMSKFGIHRIDTGPVTPNKPKQ